MLHIHRSWKSKVLILVVSLFCAVLTNKDSEKGGNDKKKDEEAENDRNKVNCTKNAWGYTECKCLDNPITARYIDHDEKTCEFYYLCHLGRAMKKKCNFDEAFHPKLRECLPRNRVPYNICKPVVECPLQKNQYLEDRRDCTKYFLCYYGRYTHWSCPEGNYFDPKGEQCLKDKQHAEACMILARRNFYKRTGYEEPPPKTSVALDQARKYMQGRKSSRSPRQG